jgi:hypothetical protein
MTTVFGSAIPCKRAARFGVSPTMPRSCASPDLRHSSIARDLLANVPVRIVAAKHDTSIPMIERNYSKYIADHADVLSRRAMLDASISSSDNVVSLTQR